MQNFNCFSPAMQEVLVTALEDSISFCEDMTKDQIDDTGTLDEKFDEFARLTTPMVIFENACIMLQVQLDPDGDAQITKNQKIALKELVLDRVQLRISKKGY